MIDDDSKEFIKRHIGPSEEDQSKMLQYVGYKSLEDLMSNTVPEKILLKEDLKIDQPMSENDALKKLKFISKKKIMIKNYFYNDAFFKKIISAKKDKRIKNEYKKILKYKKMIKFVYQNSPLGTGDAVLKTQKFIKNNFNS